MPTFEIEGPDPDGEFWVIRNEIRDAVTNRLSLSESYPSAAKAQKAVDAFNADPERAPTS